MDHPLLRRLDDASNAPDGAGLGEAPEAGEASVTPALSKVAISWRILAAACSTGRARAGARALAEAQVEVEQRLEAEVLEGGASPPARPSGGRRPGSRWAGGQIDTATRAAAAAITPSMSTGTPAVGAADDEAGQRGDLESADLRSAG